MSLIKKFTTFSRFINSQSLFAVSRWQQQSCASQECGINCEGLNQIKNDNNNGNDVSYSFLKQANENHVISSHPKVNVEEELLKPKEYHALPRSFYTSPDIFDYEFEQIFKKNWLFAGHTCEIPINKSYFIYNLSNLSVIIVRGKDGKIRAFKNTCRHRGYRLCEKEYGVANKFMCGYHRWQYDLEGNLINAGSFDKSEIDFSKYGLFNVGCREVGGLIFIHLGGIEYNDTFDEFYDYAMPNLKYQNLDEGKIILKENIIAKCNWKLLIENNRDCDHCITNHPEYNKLNFDLYYQYDPNKGHDDRVVKTPTQKDYESYVNQEKRVYDLWNKMGLPVGDTIKASWPGRGWYRVSRAFLKPGYVSQTLDGKPGCKVLLAKPNKIDNIENWDEIKYDMGTLRCNTYPNYWLYCLSDHAASTRLTPIDSLNTLVTQYWIVHKDAQPNIDFKLDSMKYVWDQTLDQDVQLCERNQLGINDDSFTPGPYSKKTEAGVNYFVHGWYLKQMKKNLNIK